MPRVGEDFVAPVLEALAESLDVRDIFARISTEAQRAITHDVLILGLAQPDGRHMRVMALSRDAPPPREVEVPPVLQAAVQSDGFILRDVTVGDDGSIVGALLADGKPPAREVRYPMQPFFRDLLQARGLRSFLRVPVRLRGEMLGGLIFC